MSTEPAPPPAVDTWGPWRRSYLQASKDAERMTKERVVNHMVISQLGDDDVRWWVAAQLPRTKQKRAST